MRSINFMKHLILIVIFCLISNQAIGDDSILRNIFDSKNTNWKFIILLRSEIKIWDPKTKLFSSLFQESKYIYNSSDIEVDSPSLCYGNTKCVFTINVIARDIGKLFLVDRNRETKSLLYEGRAIKSPSVSPDNKFIAFLSSRKSNKGYGLFVIDLSSMKCHQIIDEDVFGDGYNFHISWMPDNKHIFYSTLDEKIKIVDIQTKEIKSVTIGFDPICSPDGQKIILKKNKFKPYIPIIYNLINRDSHKIKISKIHNTIWSPDGKYLITVRNISSIFRFNEWEKEVVLIDVATNEKASLFKYEGFEYIDCK